MLRDLAVEFCAVVLNPWEMSMLTEMIRADIQLCFLACTPNRMQHNHDAGGHPSVPKETQNFTCFCPIVAHFQGILRFSMGHNARSWAQNRLKTLF